MSEGVSEGAAATVPQRHSSQWRRTKYDVSHTHFNRQNSVTSRAISNACCSLHTLCCTIIRVAYFCRVMRLSLLLPFFPHGHGQFLSQSKEEDKYSFVC